MAFHMKQKKKITFMHSHIYCEEVEVYYLKYTQLTTDIVICIAVNSVKIYLLPQVICYTTLEMEKHIRRNRKKLSLNKRKKKKIWKNKNEILIHVY